MNLYKSVLDKVQVQGDSVTQFIPNRSIGFCLLMKSRDGNDIVAEDQPYSTNGGAGLGNHMHEGLGGSDR